MGWRARSRSRLGGNTRRRGELAAALAAAGFWAGVPGRDVRLLLAEVVAGKPPLVWLGDRGWNADGEDLAEGDVEELLASMTDALGRHGVSLTVESVRRPGPHDSTGYSIAVNGRRLDLLEFDPAARGVPLATDPWLECTVKPLGLVNELLADAGSDHRVAVFNAGGNDGLAVLLPVAAIGVLADSDLIPDGERPTVPEPPADR